MPKLVDTTIRLLSQEPLAGKLPTAEVLRVAEILDGAGFACLEVSGGGVFDATVRRRVESPWERIRAIKARVSTPLGIALRGRFLVGSRPVERRHRRALRLVRGRERHRRLPPPRPAERRLEPARGGRGDHERGRRVSRRSRVQPGTHRTRPKRSSSRRASCPSSGRRGSSSTTRPARSSRTARRSWSARIREASGLPVGFYVQGAAGIGLASALAAVDAGADLIATAVYPLALDAPPRVRRVARRVAARARARAGRRRRRSSGRPRTSSTSTSATSRSRPSRLGSPSARRSTTCRPASSRRSTSICARTPPRIGCSRCSRRSAASGPRQAGRRSPRRSGRSSRRRRSCTCSRRAATARSSTSSASSCRAATARLRSRSTRRSSAPSSCSLRDARSTEDPVTDGGRPRAGRGPRRERGGARPDRDVRLRGRGAAQGHPRAPRSRDRVLRRRGCGRRARRADPRAREDRPGVGRRGDRDRGRGDARVGPARRRAVGGDPRARLGDARCRGGRSPGGAAAPADGVTRVESPMVGVFYRAPNPGAPAFVDVGDTVVPGQTLCILEAMKLFNELKAESRGVVQSIHVENAQPVEFGELLFELEPVLDAAGRLGARCSRGSSSRTEARSPCASSARCTSSGIEAVAVYSTADADALHVELADRAVCIGPPAAAESYLRISNVVAAAETTGCEAVHPGYGFLAENAEFVRACEENDLVFIGPPAEVDASRWATRCARRRRCARPASRSSPGPTAPSGLDDLRRAASERGLPRPAQGGRGRRREGHAARVEPGGARGRVRRGERRGGGGVRRRLRCTSRSCLAGTPRRDPGAVRRRRRGAHARRARVLDPAPPPEAHRGVAVAALDAATREEMEAAVAARVRDDRLPERGHVRVPRSGRTAHSTSSRSTAGSRSSIPCPSSSPGSTSSASRSGSPRASSSAATGRAARSGHAIEIRINAEDPARGFLPRRERSRASTRRSGPACASTPPSATATRSRRTTTR